MISRLPFADLVEQAGEADLPVGLGVDLVVAHHAVGLEGRQRLADLVLVEAAGLDVTARSTNRRALVGEGRVIAGLRTLYFALCAATNSALPDVFSSGLVERDRDRVVTVLPGRGLTKSSWAGPLWMKAFGR